MRKKIVIDGFSPFYVRKKYYPDQKPNQIALLQYGNNRT